MGKNCSENEKIIVILVLCVNMDKLKRHSNNGGFFSHWCIIPQPLAASMVRVGSEYLLLCLTVYVKYLCKISLMVKDLSCSADKPSKH